MRRLAALVVVVLGCDPGPARPAEPAWNKQACAHCMMLLSDKHTAAQLTLASGEREFFDDVGCLVSAVDEGRLEPKGTWVRTPDGEGWTPAESARFSSGAVTPMDFGFVPAAAGISFIELEQQVRLHVRRARAEPR